MSRDTCFATQGELGQAGYAFGVLPRGSRRTSRKPVAMVLMKHRRRSFKIDEACRGRRRTAVEFRAGDSNAQQHPGSVFAQHSDHECY